jgi:hypothetical protein
MRYFGRNNDREKRRERGRKASEWCRHTARYRVSFREIYVLPRAGKPHKQITRRRSAPPPPLLRELGMAG